MSKARVVVLEVTGGHLSVTAAARDYGLSRQHIYRLLARHRQGGLGVVREVHDHLSRHGLARHPPNGGRNLGPHETPPQHARGTPSFPSGHLSDNEQTREIRLHVANVRMRCQCGCRRPRRGRIGGKRKTWALSTLARKLGVDVTSRCACSGSTRWPFRHAIVVAPWRRVRGATRIPRNAAPATSRS